MLVSVSLTGAITELHSAADSAVAQDAAEDQLYETIKQVLDTIGATVLLVSLSPVMLLVAILVKTTSPGPAIYSQTRLTIGNRPFKLYKFRTMRADAERTTGAVFAQINDPRITSIGRFLRMTRLDELPQLFNVLKGEMSLIGPRPERPELAEELAKEFIGFNQRTLVKAGITGLAQVSSGYASSVDDYKAKLALDRLYVNNRCLSLDLKIALRTVITVVTGSGAK